MAKREEEQELQAGPVALPIEADSIPDVPPPGDQGKNRPGRQRGTDDAFTGRAAQLAVMAELLRLCCNAAIPEVDLGTDVFVFKDDRAAAVRLQVKACAASHDYKDESGYSAKFALPMKQFHRPDDPPLFYALAVLRDGKWADFLVVSRAKLQSYYNGDEPFGSLNNVNSELVLTVEFRKEVTCSGQTLTDCRNAWESLPPLQATPGLQQVIQDEAEAAGPADTDLAPPAPPGQA